MFPGKHQSTQIYLYHKCSIKYPHMIQLNKHEEARFPSSRHKTQRRESGCMKFRWPIFFPLGLFPARSFPRRFFPHRFFPRRFFLASLFRFVASFARVRIEDSSRNSFASMAYFEKQGTFRWEFSGGGGIFQSLIWRVACEQKRQMH